MAAISLTAASGVAAQDMDQGEARITARSDVQLEIESAPGTNSDKLQAIGSAVGTQMRDIRKCYSEIVAERPTVEGSQRLKVDIPARGKANVTVERDGVSDDALKRCVLKAVQSAKFDKVERPAAAFLGLEFKNSAAEGARTTEVRQARAGEVRVSTDADGKPQAKSKTPKGEIQVVVTGVSATPDSVAEVMRSLRAALPSFMDCRRRAGWREGSPDGETAIDLHVGRNGAPRTRALRSSVADTRAPQCVAKGVNQATYSGDAAGHFRVDVTFVGGTVRPEEERR